MKAWKLQDAKAKFSELIRCSVKQPQLITVRSDEVAVVISKSLYDKFIGKNQTFIDFFRKSPLLGVDLHISRDKSLPRDIEL